jgi:hypothetical protein
MTTDSKYRITDECDYAICAHVFDRYPNRIVRLVAPDGETIMGMVPYEIHSPPREAHLKRSFFVPYAKD